METLKKYNDLFFLDCSKRPNENSLKNIMIYSFKAVRKDLMKLFKKYNNNFFSRLFEKTGLKPSDLDVIELHDCFSANELVIINY